ncbi:hypothetical protein [Anaerorhabdus sp.]|jgi:hypothetical protein|uniref:hypothetical protein n=1 Tax=Anaerorhabdus sp. TaxID=1872524 RepID=UPI002FC92AF6
MLKEIVIIIGMFLLEGVLMFVGISEGFTGLIQVGMLGIIVIGVLLLYVLNKDSNIYWGKFNSHFKD